MATRFCLHSFLLLLVIAVIIVCVHGDETIQTIQVSESGLDTSLCISQDHPCKTLAYVFSKMSYGDFFSEISKTVINVMYNQTVETSLNFTTPVPRVKIITKISVVGFNDAFINFKHAGSSIQILQGNTDGADTALQWTWIGLGFAWVDQNGIDNEIPNIKMLRLYFLDVRDCKFVSVSLYTEFAQTVFITNNSFGNSVFCSTLNLSKVILDYSYFFFTITLPPKHVKIVNNTFENCQHHSVDSILTIDHSVQNCSFEIMNNLFTNLNDNSSYSFYKSAISVYGAPAGILIQRNRFIGNTICFIDIDVFIVHKAIVGDPCTWCIMQDNTFQSNHFLPAAGKQQPILVHINGYFNTSECNNNYIVMPHQISIDQNTFENNTHTRLMNTELGTKENIMHSTITITALTLLNNVGTSGLVVIENNDPLHENICVNLALLIVENNTSLYEDDASQSLETTIVYVKNANHLIIRDSNFRKNLGTSLVFENEQVCVMDDLLFDANSGINGGAMSLYNATINSSCQSTILFKKNYGVYGGALYLENSPSRCVCPGACLTTLEFVDNKAITSGNSVYFASSSSDFNLECKNFSMKDVGSHANNIILYSHDTACSHCLSIFPGQNIIVNISITDQFDQPSLCTAGVSILCDGQIYTCFNQHIKLSGPDSVVLVQPSNTSSSVIDTNLVLQSPNNNDSRNVLLKFLCKNSNANITINLNISRCPEGFLYDSMLNVCKCAIKTDHTVCSTVLGAVCVSHGYWYGQVDNDYIVTRCKYSECKMKNAPCPPGMQSDSNYFLLDGTQCSNGRGGVLCRICAKHFVFSFLSIHCIPEENCSSSKAVAILFFGISITLNIIALC